MNHRTIQLVLFAILTIPTHGGDGPCYSKTECDVLNTGYYKPKIIKKENGDLFHEVCWADMLTDMTGKGNYTSGYYADSKGCGRVFQTPALSENERTPIHHDPNAGDGFWDLVMDPVPGKPNELEPRRCGPTAVSTSCALENP
jgi:hypothetical protein